MPTVSNCIPPYKPKHFELCLASAIGQTFGDTEIIVSEDCPTDTIKLNYQKISGRIQYSDHPNPGRKNNVVRPVSLARGQHVKFLLGENDNIVGNVDILNTNEGFKIIEGHECIRQMTANLQNFIGEFSTAMFRRADALATPTGSLLNSGKVASRELSDVFAWVNLAADGNFVAHPATLSSYRQHESSNPTVNLDFFYSINDWVIIVEHVEASGYLPANMQAMVYGNLIRDYGYWLPQFPQLEGEVADFPRRLKEIAL